MVSEVCSDAKLWGWGSLLFSCFYFSMVHLFSKVGGKKPNRAGLKWEGEIFSNNNELTADL